MSRYFWCPGHSQHLQMVSENCVQCGTDSSLLQKPDDSVHFWENCSDFTCEPQQPPNIVRYHPHHQGRGWIRVGVGGDVLVVVPERPGHCEPTQSVRLMFCRSSRHWSQYTVLGRESLSPNLLMRSSLEEILKVEVVAEIRKKATMTNFIEKIINCSFL